MAAAQYRRDRKLVKRAQAGDRRAFEKLYTAYYHYVHNIVYEMVRSTHEAEELTQEIFAKAHKSIASLQNPAGFQKWLSTIARNSCLDFLRKRQRAPVELGSNGLDLAASDESQSVPSSEDEVVNRQKAEIIQQIIDDLPEKQRNIVMMHYLEGLSGKEIAEQTGSNTSAVYSSLHKARRSLKERLQEFKDTGALTVFGIPLTKAAREAARIARQSSQNGQGSEERVSKLGALLPRLASDPSVAGVSSHVGQAVAALSLVLVVAPLGTVTYSNVQYGEKPIDFPAFFERVGEIGSLADLGKVMSPAAAGESPYADVALGEDDPSNPLADEGGAGEENSSYRSDEDGSAAAAGDEVADGVPGESASASAGDSASSNSGGGGSSKPKASSNAGSGSSAPKVIPRPSNPTSPTFGGSGDAGGSGDSNKGGSPAGSVDNGGATSPQTPAVVPPPAQVDRAGTITFANAKWLVLAQDTEGNSLIVREYALEGFVGFGASSSYADNVATDPNTLKKAMADFYTGLSAADKARVQPTDALSRIEPAGNDINDESGCSHVSATGEKIAFPLSRYEAAHYFADNESRVLFRDGDIVTETWWLRSPGSGTMLASYVLLDGSIRSGQSSNPTYMVRPALWVRL